MSSRIENTVDRLVTLVLRMQAGQEVTSAYIFKNFPVSLATAKRDVLKLQCLLSVNVRTEYRNVGCRHHQRVLWMASEARA